MARGRDAERRRILVIDDNEAIHDDFRKIFGAPSPAAAIDALEREIFGDAPERAAHAFEIDFAHQGEQGLERVRGALREGAPYALAFVDVRMPPGWDGVETLERIWREDPALQAVLCTAYMDYSFADLQARLPAVDRYLILKKPLEAIEARQMAHALTEKWLQQRRMTEAHAALAEREAELQALLEAIPDAIARLDGSGAFTAWRTPRGQSAAAYTPRAEVRGLGDLVPEGALAGALEQVAAAIERGEPQLFEYTAELAGGERTFEARFARSGPAEAVALVRDTSLRKQAEEERARRLEQHLLLRSQAEALDALAAPFIPVGRDVAVVPLVGDLEAKRVERVREVVLTGIASQRCRTVILDLTGVPTLDERAAIEMERTASATRLLGATMMLTGLRPGSARRLVEMGVSFGGSVAVYQTLLRGIEVALGRAR